MKHDKHMPEQYEEKIEERESRFRSMWRNLKNSAINKISRGAASIMKIIPRARGENWRQNHPHSQNKNHKKD